VTTAGRQQPEAYEAPGTAFAYVQAQLDALSSAFALETQQQLISGAFRAIFHRSLGFPLGTYPPGRSRLNEDGIPIQFATAVGLHPSPLRFVGDVGPLEGDGSLRMRFARKAMEDVATIISAEAELEAIRPLLDEVAPEHNRACQDDYAGRLWIGAAFATNNVPRMRVYVNGSWGSGPQRWSRLRAFATHFGHAQAWDTLKEILPSSLCPMGVAVTLGHGDQARGAIYLRAFGLRLTDYVTLASAVAGATNADVIQAFGAALLGDDASYPTPSAVLSLGFGPDPRPVAELEFCGHCLFADDATAHNRLLRFFSAAGLDVAPYQALTETLSVGAPPEAQLRRHSFIGLDAKSARPVYTVYMKPHLSPHND
jgi:hypothetical protein